MLLAFETFVLGNGLCFILPMFNFSTTIWKVIMLPSWKLVSHIGILGKFALSYFPHFAFILVLKSCMLYPQHVITHHISNTNLCLFPDFTSNPVELSKWDKGFLVIRLS